MEFILCWPTAPWHNTYPAVCDILTDTELKKMSFPFSLISTAESFSVKSGLLITVYESLLTGMCLYHVHVCACSAQNSIRTTPGAGAPECHEM